MWGKSKNLCLELHSYNYSMDLAKKSNLPVKSLYQWNLAKLSSWVKEQLNYTRAIKGAGYNLSKVPKKYLKNKENPFVNLPFRDCDGVYFFSSQYICHENKGPGFLSSEFADYENPVPSFNEQFNITSFRQNLATKLYHTHRHKRARRTRRRKLAEGDNEKVDIDNGKTLLDTFSTDDAAGNAAVDKGNVDSLRNKMNKGQDLQKHNNSFADLHLNATATSVMQNVRPILFYPTKGLHLLRAEALLFNYYLMLLDAIFALEGDLFDPRSWKNHHFLNGVVEMFPLLMYYQNKLEILQVPPTPTPVYARPTEVRESMACYTNYQPNFHNMTTNSLSKLNAPELTLTSLVVGKKGWSSAASPLNSVSEQFGLKDLKYIYRVRAKSSFMLLHSLFITLLFSHTSISFFQGTGSGKTINIKLANVRYGIIKIYSPMELPYTLKFCNFFLDPFFSFNQFSAINKQLQAFVSYRPTKRLYLLGNRTYSEFDRIMTITNVPPGNHILTIVTPKNNESFTTSISHVVIM
jgi:hypothetical protein